MKKLYSLFTALLVMASLTASAAGQGTAESPYSVSEALEIILSGDIPGDNVFVEGIVSHVREISTSFGNASYYISDDGTTENQLYIYRGFYLNKEKFTSEDQLKVGDRVVVYGLLYNYNETQPEMKQGNYICSINGPVNPLPGTGEGTLDNPYDATRAVAVILSGNIPEGNVFVTGVVTSIRDVYVDYGDASYYISDTGVEETQLYIYHGLYLNNEKFTSKDQLKVGDKVVVYGLLYNYNETQPEMKQGNSLSSISTPEPANGPDLEAVTYLIGNFNDWLSANPATPVDGECRWQDVVIEVSNNAVNAFNFTQATAAEIDARDWEAINKSRISAADVQSTTVNAVLDTPMEAYWMVDAAWVLPQGTYDLMLDLKTLTLTVSGSGSALDTVEVSSTTPAAYYTLTGVKVAEPVGGIFVKVHDGVATKVVR